MGSVVSASVAGKVRLFRLRSCSPAQSLRGLGSHQGRGGGTRAWFWQAERTGLGTGPYGRQRGYPTRVA